MRRRRSWRDFLGHTQKIEVKFSNKNGHQRESEQVTKGSLEKNTEDIKRSP